MVWKIKCTYPPSQLPARWLAVRLSWCVRHEQSELTQTYLYRSEDPGPCWSHWANPGITRAITINASARPLLTSMWKSQEEEQQGCSPRTKETQGFKPITRSLRALYLYERHRDENSTTSHQLSLDICVWPSCTKCTCKLWKPSRAPKIMKKIKVYTLRITLNTSDMNTLTISPNMISARGPSHSLYLESAFLNCRSPLKPKKSLLWRKRTSTSVKKSKYLFVGTESVKDLWTNI